MIDDLRHEFQHKARVAKQSPELIIWYKKLLNYTISDEEIERIKEWMQ